MAHDTIAKLIAEHLAGVDALGLTEGETLFAEAGQGAKYVLVRTTGQAVAVEPIAELRRANVQIFVKGYLPAEGNALAESILDNLTGLCSGVLEGRTATLAVKNIVIRSLPVPIVMDGNIGYSANLTIFFTITTN